MKPRVESVRAARGASDEPCVARAATPTELDWRDLRIFLAVHEQKSLAAAARVLGVDQSTVSRRLAALESALGAPLFARTPAGLRLTEEGSTIVAPAHEVRRGVQDVMRRALSGRGTGTVRLSTTEIVATGPLLEQLRKLQERHPEIDLEVRVGGQDADLLHQEADVALRLVPAGRPPGRLSEVAQKLALVAFALYAAPSYLERRGRVDSLDEHEVIAYSQSSAHRPGDEFLALHAPRARRALACDRMTTALAAAAQGVGVAVLPCAHADPDPRLRRLGAPVDREHLWLVVHPELRRVPRIRTVLDAIPRMIEPHRELFEGLRGDHELGLRAG